MLKQQYKQTRENTENNEEFQILSELGSDVIETRKQINKCALCYRLFKMLSTERTKYKLFEEEWKK